MKAGETLAKKFSIRPCGKKYILINNNKPFKEGHTHLRSIQQCLLIVYCVKHQIVRKDFSIYMLVSLIRVSEDAEYQARVLVLVDAKKHKGKKLNYRNTPKIFRQKKMCREVQVNART